MLSIIELDRLDIFNEYVIVEKDAILVVYNRLLLDVVHTLLSKIQSRINKEVE